MTVYQMSKAQFDADQQMLRMQFIDSCIGYMPDVRVVIKSERDREGRIVVTIKELGR
jgi:hypothetical protein